MAGSYNLRIRQSGAPEMAICLPVPAYDKMSALFQPQYRTGQDFLSALESSKQKMLEAIASCYPSDKKRFDYSIEDDKLHLKVLTSPRGGGERFTSEFSQNDITAMHTMAFLLGGYLHTKSSIDPAKGPVGIKGTIDEKIDSIAVKNGDAPLTELHDILTGKKTSDDTNQYISLEVTIVSKN